MIKWMNVKKNCRVSLYNRSSIHGNGMIRRKQVEMCVWFSRSEHLSHKIDNY